MHLTRATGTIPQLPQCTRTRTLCILATHARNDKPGHLVCYFPIKFNTARLIVSTPVRIVGSGTG